MAKELFTQVPRKLKSIIDEVESGKLGLPELQRGYVWKAPKVRELLDSMMKGYPIGYLMIWDSSDSQDKSKNIGIDSKSYSAPKSLIIDGQQRMTSLYAVMRHKEVMDEKYSQRFITISFNPFTRTFEVGDNAKKKAMDWIYDISDVFLNESRSFDYITEFVQSVQEARVKSGGALTSAEKQVVQQNIMDLLGVHYERPSISTNSILLRKCSQDLLVACDSL